MKKYINALFIVLSLLLVNSLWAKRFANQYSEFELPSGWQCALEGTEWVCQSVNKDRQKEAIIILAAKIRGGQDSLDRYQAYLKKQKTFILPGGKTQVSEAKYASMKEINGHRWVDALHLASEVPGFYTRYLATVKEDLGVAVTLSVSKDHYASYQTIFDKIVASLRVFRQKKVDMTGFSLKRKEEDLLDDSTFIADQAKRYDISGKKRKRTIFGLPTSDFFLYLVIAAVGVAMAAMKMRNKGKDSGAKGKKKKAKKRSTTKKE
ncbi:MAG: hypothetical protein HN353_10970 [Bdellovibrionales bacterium]|jgi:hypothetical protein|nr:hypothetical protein [Bdellovibrionales bacterium]MBT3525211.1 hypothetical protein [Bdellovibrionales bacterium]MBT7669096.1 hypothetical protein [Bdellovibrionales bacterium]MBT7768184.1 hypothetical protein [Bdellovibrionales bacterium]